MNSSKPMPIIAALLGLAAVIGAAVTLSNSGASSLEKQVDEFFAQEKESDRLQEPERKIDQLDSLQSDPAFSKLPKAKQEAVRDRLRELKAFFNFQERLKAAGNPRDAHDLGQLRQTLTRLAELRVPEQYRIEWSQTDAVGLYNNWLQDARALSKAADDVRQEYRRLAQEGNQVLIKRNAPDLPGRAKNVLDQAKQLKLPESDPGQPVPGSATVTYAMVLQIAEVDAAYQEWKKVRTKLESVSKSEKRP